MDINNQNEIELNDLVEYLFNSEPQPINSINVLFDNINIKDLFESLLMIFTFGMKKLFGDYNGQVDLSSLSQDNIVYFNKYMNSFGVNLNIEVEEVKLFKDYEKIKYNNIEINNNTKLENLKLPFFSNGMVYIINFFMIN